MTDWLMFSRGMLGALIALSMLLPSYPADAGSAANAGSAIRQPHRVQMSAMGEPVARAAAERSLSDSPLLAMTTLLDSLFGIQWSKATSVPVSTPRSYGLAGQGGLG